SAPSSCSSIAVGCTSCRAERSGPSSGSGRSAPSLPHAVAPTKRRSMAALDREQVIHVAKLARLTLREEEIPVVTQQLAKILDHIAQLQELDVSGVEPTAQVGVDRLPLRPDVPKPGVPHDLALSQAPESAGGGFVVPAFVDE